MPRPAYANGPSGTGDVDDEPSIAISESLLGELDSESLKPVVRAPVKTQPGAAPPVRQGTPLANRSIPPRGPIKR